MLKKAQKEVLPMGNDNGTTKYLIKATMKADGVVERPDVVGAIFGQTEGLLSDDLDLRELQKDDKIGRIEVDVESEKGKSKGSISIPSSLDKIRWQYLGVGVLVYFLIIICFGVSGFALESVGLESIRSLQPMLKEISPPILFTLFLDFS
ncbi:hypothetical protein AKJ46_00855 [candidate division MSBL1 archaeon SCGC-AAA833K04]|uniref:DNA primase n=1 Tax=candidate division MSBL1 archaeon SCGC-AAA833K04 TaxID=1698258 RepID=A0A133VRU1_9EURY|nr:hypothetical protein AKJ46_00855 [candidate division MSBL1 archaeon SCGC-AAA833K04]